MHIETLYKVLQGDHEQEVRVATALKAAGVAAAVKSLPYMKETIFPALSKMAKNTEGGQRIELAGVLMDMAKPLGKDAAIELVFPDVDILLVDEKVDVRLAVINRLGAFIETVGMGPSEKVGPPPPPRLCLVGRRRHLARHVSWITAQLPGDQWTRTRSSVET